VSSPRYKWWPYIRKILYDWPHLKQLHADSLTPGMTQAYGDGLWGAKNVKARPTERTALKPMSTQEGREYDAVYAAIQTTRLCADGELRLDLIGLVFWRRTHTLSGAAGIVNVSYRTARRWQSDFIYEIAHGLHYL
jgi:hypothetical protein